MVVPYTAEPPNGGVRQYGGAPHFGIWNKTDGRFQFFYKGKVYKVHRMVCEAFHGPAPAGAPVCMHLDENSANNRPDNLKWGTQKENLNSPAFVDYARGTGDAGTRWVAARIRASGGSSGAPK